MSVGEFIPRGEGKGREGGRGGRKVSVGEFIPTLTLDCKHWSKQEHQQLRYVPSCVTSPMNCETMGRFYVMVGWVV